MATNKKITQLDELTPATWADDDVIAIVDISAQETKKIQLSTFRGAVTGVSSLNASTPLTVDSATGDVTISVAIDGGGTINAVFDEDDMTSNSPTALATQQSIKAYVDSQVGTVDTLAEILANGNTTGGTDIVVSSGDVITTNTINETTAASGVTIDGVLVKDGEVDGRDVSVDGTKLDTVETNADVTDTANVTAAGALMDSELTDIAAVKALDQGVATTDSPSFAGLTATTADINGGTIDGTVIGGSSAAAGTFTTFTSTGIDDNASSTAVTIDSSQNVGIGTAAPTEKLQISAGASSAILLGYSSISGGNGYIIRSNTINPGLDFGFNIEYNDGTALYTVAHNLGTGFHIWYMGGTERMRIDSSGNVGIGTSSPDFQLDVSGTTDPRIVLQSTGTASTDDTIFMNRVGGTTATNQIWFGDSGNAATGKLQYDHSNNAMTFHTNGGTERMRITSSGRVGIGTSSPAEELHVYSNNAPIVLIEAAAGNDSRLRLLTPNDRIGFIEFGDSDDGDTGEIRYEHTTNNMVFSTNGTSEAMRIDSSGNVGIGTSSPSTLLHLASTGNAILTLEADTDNVTESDNARIELSQDGGATTGHMGYGSGTNGIDIWNDYNDYVRIGTNNIERLRVVNTGVVRPAADNTQSIGAASYRWSVVYAGTGTINTSDEREKQQIADLDDAERRVAVALKGLVKKYKYNDAVELKGDDARIHVGVIAQEVVATFEAEGLDATRYALLCYDTWEAEPEEVDKNGNVINPGIEAGERYGIRYDELLAFMIAAL